MTTRSCNVLTPSGEVHSKLTATPFMVFSVTLYLGSCNVITSYNRFGCVFTKTKKVVWTLYNINDFYLVKTYLPSIKL